MRAARRRWLAIAAACGLEAGCALVGKEPPPPRRAVLEDLPADVPHAPAARGTLLVLAPWTAPAYDTARIAYARHRHEIAYFRTLEWVARPSRMVLGLLATVMRRTHAFSAVEVAPYAGHFTHALRCEILELRQDFTGARPVLRLALHVLLRDDETGRVPLDRRFEAAVPMREGTPEAGVAAANEAVVRVLRALAAATVAALG